MLDIFQGLYSLNWRKTYDFGGNKIDVRVKCIKKDKNLPFQF